MLNNLQACWQYISDNPAVVAGSFCAVAGSFKGADIMNGETDDQLMTRGIYRSFRKCNLIVFDFTTWQNGTKTKVMVLLRLTGFYLKELLNVQWLKLHMIKI